MGLVSCGTGRDLVLPDQFHFYYDLEDSDIDNKANSARGFNHEGSSLSFGLSWNLSSPPEPAPGLTRGDLGYLIEELRTKVAEEAALRTEEAAVRAEEAALRAATASEPPPQEAPAEPAPVPEESPVVEELPAEQSPAAELASEPERPLEPVAQEPVEPSPVAPPGPEPATAAIRPPHAGGEPAEDGAAGQGILLAVAAAGLLALLGVKLGSMRRA